MLFFITLLAVKCVLATIVESIMKVNFGIEILEKVTLETELEAQK